MKAAELMLLIGKDDYPTADSEGRSQADHALDIMYNAYLATTKAFVDVAAGSGTKASHQVQAAALADAIDVAIARCGEQMAVQYLRARLESVRRRDSGSVDAGQDATPEPGRFPVGFAVPHRESPSDDS